MPFDQDSEILDRIKQSDEQAFKLVYDELAPTIFNTAMLFLKQEEEAREIVQEVFIKLWDKRQSLSEIGSLKDYLFILTRNLVFDYFEKKPGIRSCFRIGHLQQNSISNADHLVEEHLYNQLLHTAIQKLPPQQRKVYILSKNEGLDYDEIASQMSLSRNTIRKHLQLANYFVRKFVKTNLSGFLLPSPHIWPLKLFFLFYFLFHYADWIRRQSLF